MSHGINSLISRNFQGLRQLVCLAVKTTGSWARFAPTAICDIRSLNPLRDKKGGNKVTHTFLEGLLQCSNYHILLPNLFFFHELWVTLANALPTEVHRGTVLSDAFHHILQFLLDATVQVVGGQDRCFWSTMTIKQCPVVASQILKVKALRLLPSLSTLFHAVARTSGGAAGCMLALYVLFVCFVCGSHTHNSHSPASVLLWGLEL